MSESSTGSREGRRAEEHLSKLSACFLEFGADPVANINRLTALCGELMGATCALYNRLQGEMICSIGAWHEPEGFTRANGAQGHICYDVIRGGVEQPLIIRDLPNSPYAESDPNVRSYGLRTYVGKAVKWQNAYVGSLCVVYQDDYSPREQDMRIMDLVASAIGIEEERRSVVDRLTESEERYRSLIDAAPDIIYSLSVKDGTITSVNPAFEKVTGWPRSAWLGRQFHPLVHPDDLSAVAKAYRAVLRGKTPRPFELRILKKSGSYLLGGFTSGPRMENNRVVGVYGIVRDVTEHKQLEQELLRSKNLESLGMLAGGIAHDFNNLLMAILGNIFLGKMVAKPGDGVFERLDDAEKASVLAKDLVHQLLTFSKGGEPLKKVTTLHGIIRETANLVASGTNMRCEFDLPEDLLPVEVDEEQMRQVIHNLVANARDAMPLGGVVAIRAANENVGGKGLPMAKGKYVRISVEDSGVGISEAHLPKIFDPYFSTKEVGPKKGMGLGLAICYSIVKKHEGHITVESQAGQGTALHVYLPASVRKAPRAGRKAPETTHGPDGGKGRVLVMDDVSMVRDIASAILTHLGYEAACAIDGEEAVKLYGESLEAGTPFDAVILDLTVPGGMGGYETLERLLELDHHVNAIISTGYTDDVILSEFGNYGFKGAIAKPYKTDDLGELLSRVITSAR
jgi:two-component system, cell cycle sensor histidine kinase and response regulator CckA